MLSTDSGQPGNPPTVEIYLDMISHLLAEGITPAEIRQMSVETPAALMNL